MPDRNRPKDLPALPSRAASAHKGDFGSVLIIGGSRGMAGAVVLAARAAMRAGAGTVTVAVPEDIFTVVAGHLVECMTALLQAQADGTIAEKAGQRLARAIERADAVAFGPGLGRNENLSELGRWVVENVPLPLVIDADGLNSIVPHVDRLRARSAPTVLTPHPKEMSRLAGRAMADVQANREGTAEALAERTGAVVVLKGQGTAIAAGGRTVVNPTGNPGMATGGSGDVLTGIIAAFIGQGMQPVDAAVLGVYVHGLAGDLARDAVGEVSLIASDLIDHLPAAIRSIADGPAVSTT